MAIFTDAEIIEIIREHQSSSRRDKLVQLQALYDAENPQILRSGSQKAMKGKTPNNVIPTGYYSTVTDTMAGYMFQEVQYTCMDETLQENLDAILRANNIQVEDMVMGTSALAYNRGVEYIYTDTNSDIKVKKLNPANTIVLYSQDIESIAIAAINYSVADSQKEIYNVLYIEPKLKRTFKLKGEKITEAVDVPLYFSVLPVIEYKAQILGHKAPFEVIVPYIEALDALISGNANEIDRLTDAILLLGSTIDQADLAHMEDIKAFMDVKAEDRYEYITKESSPEFRKYVSELLIREIYKHSHTVDWTASSEGQVSDASGKALKMRLFDMDMYSKRIEMAYREGAQNRLIALSDLAVPLNMPIGDVRITYHRTMIDDLLDDAVKLEQVTFLTDITKREMLHVDEEKEQERIAEERPEGVIIDTEA